MHYSSEPSARFLFQKVAVITVKEYDLKQAAKPCNQAKNRHAQFVPGTDFSFIDSCSVGAKRGTPRKYAFLPCGHLDF